jgi:hypothetical protein
MAMKTPVLALAALLGASCATYDGHSLRPGVSTEADVLGLMGRPAVAYVTADGTRRLAYPRGPLGTQTYMVELGPDGRVRDVRNALTDETFHQISAGMTRDEVLSLIGPPGDAMHFSRLDQESWEYRFVDTWGYRAIFSVNFDRNGLVVSKFSRRLERDRGFN